MACGSCELRAIFLYTSQFSICLAVAKVCINHRNYC